MEKIQAIRDELNGYFIERAEEVDLALTALLSGSTMLMLGPPGTAKSQICRAIAGHIQGANYFEWLLTKFTTPEEIFGTLDLNALKEGRFIRKVEGKLPTAHIAFIDEIFKASSAILNSLLTIINERIYHNNSVPMKVSLITLYSASNELPEDDSLKALYDRLIIRKIVEPIHDYNNWHRLGKLPKKYEPKTFLSLEELQNIINTVEAMNIDPVMDDLIKIRLALKNKGIEVSDRRFRQAFDIVKAYAYVRGATQPDVEHLEVLQFVFWDEPEQIHTVRSVILQVSNPLSAKASEYIEILNEYDKELQKYSEVTPEVIEMYNKINKIVEELKGVFEEAKRSGKNTILIEKVLSRAENLKRRIAKDIIKLSF